MVEPKAVLALLTFAGRTVGIGASRPMGWGRFTVAGTVGGDVSDEETARRR